VGDGDWFAMMRANFQSLAEALGEPVASTTEPAPAEAPR
jgi:hypothetical protein